MLDRVSFGLYWRCSQELFLTRWRKLAFPRGVGMKVDLASLPRDGKRYYWSANGGGWWDAKNDPAVVEYWFVNGRIMRDEPVIVENTYYGSRENRTVVVE